MTRRRPYIEQKRPVFVGCEGLSECGYVGVVQDLVRDAGLPVHLIIQELAPGAGDPLARVELAVRRIDHLRKTRTAPTDRFVFLDFDQAERDAERAARAERLAADHNIQIVWQRPCFEAVLLRHIAGRAANRPPDTPKAARALLREWPDYQKPMTRAALSRKIDLAAILRAAAVEPELRLMLICLGLIPTND